MRIKNINQFFGTAGRFICPVCREELKLAYTFDQVFMCEKCKSVYELFFKKSKITIKQIKKDGWFK